MSIRPGPRRAVLLLAALYLGLPGCAKAPAEPAGPSPRSWEVEFKGADGEAVFSLERKRDGIRVEDAAGNELVNLIAAPARIGVLDGHGTALGRVEPVVGDHPGLRVVDANGALLFQLLLEKDGDFTLRDATGSRLYEAKLRDYGYKVVGPDGAVESRVRKKPEKISVRDAKGNTIFYTRDAIPARAVAVLTLDRVPIEFAAGMAVAIVRGMVPR